LFLTLDGGPGAGSRSLAWTDLSARVAPVEFSAPEVRRVRNSAEFARRLRLVETGPVFRVPRVDFIRNEVVMFAVGPRSSAGYSLTVRSVRAVHGSTVVTVDEHSPALGSTAAARLTFPFILIAVPRSNGQLTVDWPQRP
jgi:hypothetical protein